MGVCCNTLIFLPENWLADKVKSCSLSPSLFYNRGRNRMVLDKPHQGEGTGPSGQCGVPVGGPQYCGGPCPLQLYVPGQTAGEHPGRSSSGQRYWRPSFPEESHRC